MYLKFPWLCMGLPTPAAPSLNAYLRAGYRSPAQLSLDKGGWCENPGTRNEVSGLSQLVLLAAQKKAYLCCCSGMFTLGHGLQTKLAVETLEPTAWVQIAIQPPGPTPFLFKKY